MFRAEEAEYERQLRAAKVPDQVTVSRVVMQVWKEGFFHNRFLEDFFLLQYSRSEEILKEGSLLLYLIQRTSLWEVHKLPNYYIYI